MFEIEETLSGSGPDEGVAAANRAIARLASRGAGYGAEAARADP